MRFNICKSFLNFLDWDVSLNSLPYSVVVIARNLNGFFNPILTAAEELVWRFKTPTNRRKRQNLRAFTSFVTLG